MPITVNFGVNRGPKVKIQKITFGDSLSVKEGRLVRSMKKTKDKRLINFFSSKSSTEKEYENDKKNLISAFNEAGYEDARILKDSIYYVEPGRLQIDFKIGRGQEILFQEHNLDRKLGVFHGRPQRGPDDKERRCV